MSLFVECIMGRKVLVLLAAVVVVAAGVFVFMESDYGKYGKALLGIHDTVTIDYSDDGVTVYPETVTIPDDIDQSAGSEAQTIVKNHQKELDDLADAAKNDIANVYEQADAWGKAHPEIEQSLPYAHLVSTGEYYRGMDAFGNFTESALSFILRGKNISEYKAESLENQYVQKLQELCPELNSMFQRHGLTLTPESLELVLAYGGYGCWDYDGAREDWHFDEPPPDGYPEAFFKEYYFYNDYGGELADFYDQTISLSDQMWSAIGDREEFNDMVSTYLEYCSESEKQAVNSFIEQIDASQLEYCLRVAEIQAQIQKELSALDKSELVSIDVG